MAKELHNFDGNEVIATDLPQYLNQNFTSIPSNMGVWDKNEEVEVGDIRFLSGRENTGYILECVSSGTTGETQPVIIEEDVNLVANYTDSGVVGRMRLIFNSAEKDVDEVFATGVVYSRSSYPELWEYAQLRAGLLIDEEEWQAKFAETDGKFVPYYSRGDGSTTFRTPLLGAYAKGAETAGDVGKWMDAGLPNVYGNFTAGGYVSGNVSHMNGIVRNAYGAFYAKESYPVLKISGLGADVNSSITDVGFDASRFNSIYGNSDTVTPDTMVGIWVIKAVGVVVDSGNTDIAQALQGIEQMQSNYLPLSGGVMNGTILTNSTVIASEHNGNKVTIHGGKSWDVGGNLQLCGQDVTNEGGSFLLSARKTNADGSKSVNSLIGYPDGRLNLNGLPVLTRVSQNLSNDGYMKFSNGLILQWFYENGINGQKTITLPTPFTNNSFIAVATHWSGGYNSAVNVSIFGKTATNITLYTPSNIGVMCIMVGW